MKTIDTIQGDLDWVLGSGWLSRYEAARLAPGTVLRSQGIAGRNLELRFNGAVFAETGTVVFDGERGYLCAVLKSLDRSPGIPPQPYRGDELTELLPFEIVLGSRRVTLEDLSGLGPGSIVDFDVDPDSDDNCLLTIAGHRAARGRACVLGESFGIRLRTVLGSAAGTARYRSTGNRIDPSAVVGPVKDYDFRRPDFFTKRQLERLHDLHSEFLRSFVSLSKAGFAGASVVNTDQLNFSEFLDSIDPGTKIIVAPTGAAVRPKSGGARQPEKTVLPAGAGFPVDRAEEWVRDARDTYESRGDVVFAAGSIPEASLGELFEALRDAWKPNGALSPYPADAFTIGETGRYARFGGRMGEYEMTAVVICDLGATGRLVFAYPGRTLAKLLPPD